MRLHDLLDLQARERPESVFAVHNDRQITFREAAVESRRLANAFVRAGYGLGHRIAFLSKNTIEHVLVYFACSRVGVVPVPLNFRLPPSQWVDQINDAGARIVIAQAPLAEALETVRHKLRSVEHFVRIAGGDAAHWHHYHDWLGAESDASTACPVTADDDVYQFYTSGTTGAAKGVVITHRAVIAHLHQISTLFDVRAGDRSLVITPLSHAHAAMQAFLAAGWGGSLYIVDEFEPEELIRVLTEERVTIATVVPSIIHTCLTAVPDIKNCSFDSLRLLHYGGSPIAARTLRQAMAVFQCDFIQGYGMTETTAGITFLLPADHRNALARNPTLLTSAGRPVVGMQVWIADEHDNPLPAGKVGQVITRGPSLMRGYWRRPKESAQALRGGWMHTGDLGYVNNDGYVYIVDRANDVINSAGENVYPRIVEAVLSQHPAIAQAAAIGVPDDRLGETVKAIVVLREGAVATTNDILDFCRQRLAGFQQPRSIHFRDALPYTASGKVHRRTLREPYWKDSNRRVRGA